MKRVLKAVDLYQKIPKDLTESTEGGAFLSICAGIFMVLLFHIELYGYLVWRPETYVVLDDAQETKLQINFNVTLMDMPCEYLHVDVLDVLGTNRVNVTADVHKWHLDSAGLTRAYFGRNRAQRDIVTWEEDLPELHHLHEDGVHVIELGSDDFRPWLEDNSFTFVLFYAPWCIWCQQVMPTWEALAGVVEEMGLPMSVAQVDCAEFSALCVTQRVQAFPMMRLYHGFAALDPDYRADRVVGSLLAWAKQQIEEQRRIHGDGDEVAKAARKLEAVTHDDSWPGCMVAGTLHVNRVPGNFHIEAGSKSHTFHAATTNLSHIVHHLSFGPRPTRRVNRRLASMDSELVQLAPIDGNVYIVEQIHNAFHHYLKVVPTQYDVNMRKPWQAYQALATSQLMHYAEEEVPEARFAYTLSPMAVHVKLEGTRWYKLMTSLLAITGGTFSILGLVDALVYKMRGKKKALR